MDDSLFLICDTGTINCKVALFDLEGNMLHREIIEYPGWKELNVKVVLKAAKTAIKSTIRRIKKPTRDLVGIGFSTGGNKVMLDKNGEVLHSPNYKDEALNRLIELRREYWDKQINRNELQTYAEISVLKERWPNFFKKIHKIMSWKDFVIYRFTGEIVTDEWLSPFKDVKGRPTKVADLVEFPIEKVPEVYKSTDIIETLKKEIAKELGVSQDVPIGIGSWDGTCASIGSNLIEPGQAYAIIHTGSTFRVISNKKRAFNPKKRPWWVDPTILSYLPSSYQIMSHSTAGGACLQWFRDNFEKEKIEYAKLFRISPEAVYQIMDFEANKVNPGSDGLISLPYLLGGMIGGGDPMGENPEALGAILGFSMSHTKAHFIRSIMEGVAYSLKNLVDLSEEEGFKVKDVRLIGGGARSEVWQQICTDVFEKETISLKVPEAALCGAAILLATGIKRYKNVPDAMKSMVHIKQRRTPNKKFRKEYQLGYKRYIEFSEKMNTI